MLGELPAGMGDVGGSDVFVTERHDLLVKEVEDLKKEVAGLAGTVERQERVIQTCDRAMRSYNDRAERAQFLLTQRRTALRKHAHWLKWLSIFCFILTIVLGVAISQAPLSPDLRVVFGIVELRTLFFGVVFGVLSKVWFKVWNRPDVLRL